MLWHRGAVFVIIIVAYISPFITSIYAVVGVGLSMKLKNVLVEKYI